MDELKVGDLVEGAGEITSMRIVSIERQKYRLRPIPKAVCEWEEGGTLHTRTFALSGLRKINKPV